MLRNDPEQTEFVDFLSPFGNKLPADNRWVKLASIMPWELVEECYSESLAGTGMGRSALFGRVAYGALIIKERLGITDEATTEQIRENPYLQFFLGLTEFREKPLFNPSMMVHFRSRFDVQAHEKINTALLAKAKKANREELKEQKKQNLVDERARVPVEGKFGNAKRKGSLSRIMAKLSHPSESIVHLGIIVRNLDTWLRRERRALLCALMKWIRRVRAAVHQENKVGVGSTSPMHPRLIPSH